MHAQSQVIHRGIGAAVGLLSTLALSAAFPALGNPVALAVGAGAGLLFASRERLALGSAAGRFALVAAALASAGLAWLLLQPGYIGS